MKVVTYVVAFKLLGFRLCVPFSLTLIADLKLKVMARIMRIRTHEAKRQVGSIQNTSRLMQLKHLRHSRCIAPTPLRQQFSYDISYHEA
jgi:hypothetical protein